MGIPGMYGWLVKRYPNTICSVAEDRSPYLRGGERTKTELANPNGVEFDNLYLDMNGIIHNCFHPEGLPSPNSYHQIFKFIFRYIDRVFSIVRPRKLFFLSVDGVAPRAKMNHQRIRRFRAAKEAAASKVSPAADVKKLDSNVITPGTEFMTLLSSALRWYIHRNMELDPGWRGIKVILSDSTVAGEGEDKIMSFIRSQRNLPGYDPNTRHCLHGLDADLIMLALATHEIHVSILREVISYGRISRHVKDDGKNHKYPPCMQRFLHHLNFEFFNIWVLREYLERELLPNIDGADFDRLIDDFVFICFFVGNDFLPHLPSLDTSKGGIELLLIVYQEEFVKMGYLTNSPKVNLKSMEHFLQALSSHENAIFMKHDQKDTKSRRKRRVTQDSIKTDKQGILKQRYYVASFDCTIDAIDRFKRDAVFKFTEGVCWIMHYYFQGLCSWQWFYPYHYAPFASDFCGLDKLDINFTLGRPFKPLDQLLGVLPAASAQALPLFYRELMTNPSSPILDFYPKDFKVYKNGKKHAWQGVCKLPFIDESRLLYETVKVEHTLTDVEKQRNRFGKDRLFVFSDCPLGKMIRRHPFIDPGSELQIQIKPELSRGLHGYLFISNNSGRPRSIPSPIPDRSRVMSKRVVSVDYQCPSHPHIPKLPFGVMIPPRILRCQDIPPPPALWHGSPSLSQSITIESHNKKSQPKKRKQHKVQKSCMVEKLGDAGMQDYCVDVEELGMDPVQDGKGACQRVEVCEKLNNRAEEFETIRAGGAVKGGEDKMDVVAYKSVEADPPNKMEDAKVNSMMGGEVHLSSIDKTEGNIKMNGGDIKVKGVSQKDDVEGGKESTNKMDCDLVPAKLQEINVSGEHKRKKEKKGKYTKHMLGAEPDLAEGKAEESRVDEKMNDVVVSEKERKLEPAMKQEIADDKVKSSNVKASEKHTKRLNSDLVEGAKRKKHKSKQGVDENKSKQQQQIC